MTPKEYGARAWANGTPCSPYLDAEFMEMDMDDENYTARLRAYREWNRGWVAASLAGRQLSPQERYERHEKTEANKQYRRGISGIH